MMLPILKPRSIDGIAVYPDPPALVDSGGERGQARVAHRTETVTYVFQEEGRYELPAIEIPWWDSSSSRLRTASLPAIDLTVAPNPDLAEEIPLPPEEIQAEAPGSEALGRRRVVKRFALPAVLVVGLAWVVLRWVRNVLPGLRSSLREKRRQREESEAAYFRRFKTACRTGEPDAILRQLMFWLDRFVTTPGAATLEKFIRDSQEPELAKQARQLSDAVFAAGGDEPGTKAQLPSGLSFHRRVARARRRILGKWTAGPSRTTRLPGLNPS